MSEESPSCIITSIFASLRRCAVACCSRVSTMFEAGQPAGQKLEACRVTPLAGAPHLLRKERELHAIARREDVH